MKLAAKCSSFYVVEGTVRANGDGLVRDRTIESCALFCCGVGFLKYIFAMRFALDVRPLHEIGWQHRKVGNRNRHDKCGYSLVRSKEDAKRIQLLDLLTRAGSSLLGRCRHQNQQ